MTTKGSRLRPGLVKASPSRWQHTMAPCADPTGREVPGMGPDLACDPQSAAPIGAAGWTAGAEGVGTSRLWALRLEKAMAANRTTRATPAMA